MIFMFHDNNQASLSIILGCKLTSAAQTFIIEFTYGLNVNGITPLNILKHLSFLINRSTCTQGFAILLVAVEVLAEILPFFIKGGTSNLVW